MTLEKYFAIDRELAQQLISATKNMRHARSGDNSFQNTRVFLFDEYAVLQSQNINVRNVDTQDPALKHLERLANTLLALQANGVNVVPILAVQSDDGHGYIIQPRAIGTELYDRYKINEKQYVLKRVAFLSNAPQNHFDKFIADTIKIVDAGIIVDFIGKDNFFYDESIGFQFVDLNAHFDHEYGLTDVIPPAVQFALWNCFAPCYFDTVPKYRDTVTKILSALTEEERALLMAHNRIIFEKCKAAMRNNGISEKEINAVILNESFIPQKQQLGLL